MDGLGEFLQLRIDAALDAAEEMQDAAERVRDGLELAQRQDVDAGSGALEGGQEGDRVDVARRGEILLEHQDEAHLVREGEALPDDACIGGKMLLRHPRGGIIRQAPVRNQLADLVETQFSFKSLVCHSVVSPSSRFRVLMVSTEEICPFRTKEIPPVSSLTTITSASHCSEMPMAALWRMP